MPVRQFTEMEDHVFDLMTTLVLLSQEQHQDFRADCLLPACRDLENLLVSQISPTLANQATSTLMSLVFKQYKNLENSFCRNDRKKETKRRMKRYLDVQDMYPTIKRKNYLCKNRLVVCREIALEVGCAIFHPATTELEFGTENVARNPTFSGFTNLYLGKLLRKGKNLKKLVISEHVSRKTLSENLPHLKNLEMFRFRNADDAILEALSLSCTEIKQLNISQSSNVTDESIPHILKMRNLESLKIDGTSISEEGFTQVLKGLPFCCGLQCLRAKLAPSHINDLSEKCKELSCLEASLTEYCDISPLKKLLHLTNLNVYVGELEPKMLSHKSRSSLAWSKCCCP